MDVFLLLWLFSVLQNMMSFVGLMTIDSNRTHLSARNSGRKELEDFGRESNLDTVSLMVMLLKS